MKFPPPPLAKLPWQARAALLLTLLVSGCESDGSTSARAQEKSAAYAALRPWQKKYVDVGSITEGFTPDMVYIALGRPDQVDPKELPEGKTERWTYRRFYPRADAVRAFMKAISTGESEYVPSGGAQETNSRGSLTPGTSRNGLANSNNNSGAMEPDDLRSYTVEVTFKNGKVVRISGQLNP